VTTREEEESQKRECGKWEDATYIQGLALQGGTMHPGDLMQNRKVRRVGADMVMNTDT